MKKIILASLLFAFGLTACNDDFMERYPKTSLTEENAFLEYNSFKAFAYPLYAAFTNTGIRTNFNNFHFQSQLYGDLYAGIMLNRDNVMANQYAYRTITQTSTHGVWTNAYTNLRRINLMISHVDDGVLSDAQAKHWRSVGYFFAAWWYMELIDRFGDVPWVDKVLSDNSPEAYGERTPRAEVVENVCNYFEYAIANIGDYNDGDNTITADAVKAAYSRFLLREGTWAKYHKLTDEDANKYLKRCLEVSQELMNSYPTLYQGVDPKNPATGYGELWTTESLAGVPGVILCKEYVDALLMHRGNDYEHIAANGSEAPQHTIDMFLMKNGKPIGNAASGYQGGKGKDLYAVFADRDPRLYLNIQPPYAVKAFSGTPDYVNSFPTWQYYKEGDALQGNNHIVTAEDAAKFRTYIDLMGANEKCVRGGSFGGEGMKRCPGQNWGAALTPGSPNLESHNAVAYMRSRTGYYFWKNYDMWEFATGDSAFCTADKPIFKIEEVLLNYAEAAWELGLFNQTVADNTINKLRERVGVAKMNVSEIDDNFDPNRDKGMAPWWTGSKENYNVNPVLWEIRRERQIELFGEGFGFYDVRRWAKAAYYVNRQPCGMYIKASDDIYVMNKAQFTGSFVDYEQIKATGQAAGVGNSADGEGWIYTAPSPLVQGGGWIDTYYLDMVPTNEIVLNPNLTQNPGYNELFNL